MSARPFSSGSTISEPPVIAADAHIPDPVDLSEGELHALRNLARKHAGEPVPFINIADARSLTDAGLATRGREGWDITPAGLAQVAAASRPREV